MSAAVIEGLAREDEARLTAGGAMWSTHAVPGLDIPALTLSDGPMGIASPRIDEREVARLTPSGVALGASFDRDLVRRVGTLVGLEAVAKGVDMVLAPNLNLARSPLAGRAFEYFSEDPLLAGLIGAAWVGGLQSTGTGAVPKHLVCNDSETDRDVVDVRVTERALREVYMLPFEICAEAGASAMLTAYNRVNGRWCSEQEHVIGIVKSEWKFDGPLISDWFGTHSTIGTLNGGLDLEMPGPGRFMGHKALPAVEAGEIAAERLADAAGRVARAARRWGGKKTEVATEDADALLVEAAAAGMVLLRNRDALLPFTPQALRRIAVIGPNASAPCYQGGTFAKIAVAPDVVTPLEAIVARFGGMCEVLHEPGVDPTPRLPPMPVTPGRALPDGKTRGMTIDYFADRDTSQRPTASETRDTNSLTWFAGVHDEVTFSQSSAIRATGWFEAERAGEYSFHVGATGPVCLRVGGRVLIDVKEGVSSGDVMGVLKAGDSQSATIALRAQERVLVDILFHPEPARAHGLWYGVRSPDDADAMMARAVALAAEVDAVVLLLGESTDASVESKDRPDSRIDAAQLLLAEKVMATNPNTAVVVNVGHAFDASFATDAPALLLAWYPGEGFGRGLAEVLAGDREPGGRLPLTLAAREEDYPAFDLHPQADGRLTYTDDVLIGYRSFMAKGVPALHAFGTGQGYTRFTLIGAEADGDRIVATLRNDGARMGQEVVQLYRLDPEAALVGFGKIRLAPGETGRLAIAIDPRAMRLWRDGWQAITGPVDIAVGRASDDLPLTVRIERDG